MAHRVLTIFLVFFLSCGRSGPPLPFVSLSLPPPDILIVGRFGEKAFIRTATKTDPFVFRFFPNRDLCSPPVVGKVERLPWEGWYSFPAETSGSVEFLRDAGSVRSSPWFLAEKMEAGDFSSPLTGDVLMSGEVVLQGDPGIKIFLEKKTESLWEPLGIKVSPIRMGPFPPQTILKFLYLPIKETPQGYLFLAPPRMITLAVP